MKNIAVVFDTNAYRDLCGKIPPPGGWTGAALRIPEGQRGITAYANPFVIMELASHLWDVNDPAYTECRCALTALFDHCRVGTEHGLRLVAPSEHMISKLLYDRDPPGHANTTEQVARLAVAIGTAASGPLDPRAMALCKEIADILDTRENVFVRDMQAVVCYLNPAAPGWNPFNADKAGRDARLKDVLDPKMRRAIAEGYVRKARSQVGVPNSEPGLDKDIDNVLEAGSVAIVLYQAILARIVSTGCDVSKKGRANWLWDMQIAFAIGGDIGDPPCPLVLVTGDQDVIDAAKAASLGSHVKSLNEYLSAL